MEVALFIMPPVIGACIGSFLCCQARRLHLRERRRSRYSSTRPKPSFPARSKPSPSVHSQSPLPTRSICLHCRYQLKWYDNIPIISWLVLRGRCRKCHKPIGVAEILSEIGASLSFLALWLHFYVTHLTGGIAAPTSDTSSLFALTPAFAPTPIDWAIFIVILIFTSALLFLAIYDGLYGQLPTLFLTISIICAIILVTLKDWASLSVVSFSPEAYIFQPLGSILILSGLYLVLYLISRGRWVGDGDWLLALSVAIVLAHPFLALATLCLANLFACVYALPHRQNHLRIHLGPFLVAAFVIIYSLSEPLLLLLP